MWKFSAEGERTTKAHHESFLKELFDEGVIWILSVVALCIFSAL